MDGGLIAPVSQVCPVYGQPSFEVWICDAQTAGIGELGALLGNRVVSVGECVIRQLPVGGLELPAKGEDRRSHDSDWLQKLSHRISRHISCTHPGDRLL
jgi:hypothetical protein